MQHCNNDLQCKLVMQTCNDKLQCKIAMLNCIPKLECKIGVQNGSGNCNAKFKCKNAVHKLWNAMLLLCFTNLTVWGLCWGHCLFIVCFVGFLRVFVLHISSEAHRDLLFVVLCCARVRVFFVQASRCVYSYHVFPVLFVYCLVCFLFLSVLLVFVCFCCLLVNVFVFCCSCYFYLYSS